MPPKALPLERPFDSWDAIKILALLLMFVDHTGAFFYTDVKYQWLRAIGRGSAPIFMFLAGYASSYRFKWDLFFLGVLMCISDFLLAGYLRTQNILFTILLTRMFFKWVESRPTKIIKSPWQWVIGSSAWLLSIAVFQYGTLCLMYALCAYVKKRKDQYTQQQFNGTLILTCAIYALITQLTFQMTWPNCALTVFVVSCVGYLLWKIEIRPLDMSRFPRPLVWFLQQAAMYSGYIYALHMIALEWISGIPF